MGGYDDLLAKYHYSDGQKAQLTDELNKALTAVDQAASQNAIDKAVEGGIAAMDAVPKAATQADLDKFINDLKEHHADLVGMNTYTAGNREKLDSILADAITELNSTFAAGTTKDALEDIAWSTARSTGSPGDPEQAALTAK